MSCRFSPWSLRTTTLDYAQPIIMAILNVTPDSFSDGGRFRESQDGAFEVDLDAVVDAAKKALRDGAAILDVGGESTRPGTDPIEEAEELRRVIPVVKALRRAVDAPISVDTYRPSVAAAALEEGAQIVNDVAAGRYIESEKRFADENEEGFREEMAEVVAQYGAAVVLMHMKGAPKTMQTGKIEYPLGVVEEVCAFLERRRDAFLNAGVDEYKICYDPGLGFGKTFEQNWELAMRSEYFRRLGGPVLYGYSRKSMLRENARRYREECGIAPENALPDRATLDFETGVLSAILATKGVEVLRVHDVPGTALALRVAALTYNDPLVNSASILE